MIHGKPNACPTFLEGSSKQRRMSEARWMCRVVGSARCFFSSPHIYCQLKIFKHLNIRIIFRVGRTDGKLVVGGSVGTPNLA